MGVRTDKVQVEVEINGKKAGESINDLNKSYKQLNRERNQLTVGTDEYIKKTEALKGVKSRLDDVKNEVKGIDAANKSTVDSFMEFMPFNGQFQAMKGSLGGVKGQVSGVSKGFGTLRGAIISTGIGALVILIGTLITYLTSTQEGMDKVTAVTRPLLAIFEKMKGVVQELSGSVFKGLAQIINGELTAGLETLKNGFTEAGEASKDAFEEGWKAGTKLDQLQKEIERDEIKTIKRRRELELIAKQQNFIVEDETKSYDERREAAQKALAAQEELENIQLNLMDKKIEKMKLEHTLNDTSREDEKELAELEASRAEKSASVVEMRTTTRNKLNILNKGEQAEYQKMLDAKAKAREEMLKKEEAAERSLQDLRIHIMEESLEKHIAQLDLEYERKRETIDGNEAQITEQLGLLEHERQAKLEEVKLEWSEKEAARKEKEFADQLENNAEKEEMQMLLLEEKYAKALLAEEEYEEARYELQKAALEERLDMVKALHGEESLEAQRIKTELALLDETRIADKIESEKKAEEQIRKIKEAGYQGAKDLVSLGMELLDQEEDGKKKQNKALRAFAAAQIAINLAEEMQGIWKNAMQLPAIIGIPLGIIQSGLAGVRAGKAIGKVTTAKYEKGGVFGGSRHGSGGNMVIDSATGQPIAEVEAGEPYMIFSRNTYANNKPVIDQLLYSSMYRNGAPIFETGGIMNPYSAGAAADASAPNASAAIASHAGKNMDIAGTNLDAQILAELRRLNITAQNWPKMLKAFVVLSELQAAQEEDDSVRADAQVK